MNPSADVEARPSFWDSVRQSLSGSDQDFTEGPLPRAIFILALPMVLEMLMESLFAVVDLFFVSRTPGGESAVAALGLTESVMTVLYALGIGVAVSATATVARRTGEKDAVGAARAGMQALYLTLAICAPLGLLGAVFAPNLLRAMGASPDVESVGSTYARIMLGGNVTVLALFVLNGVFRGAGAAPSAMRALWLGNALNIILCPLFMFGLGPLPGLGLTGAAVGTNLGRGLAVLYQLSVLFRGNRRIRFTRDAAQIRLREMWTLFRLSMGGMGQFLVSTASWIGLVRITALFGRDAVAGYTIAVRIMLFSLLPAWGLANAAATLVGQNLGAGKPDRAERSVWRTGLYNVIFLGSVGSCFFLGAELLVSLFHAEPQAHQYASTGLRIFAGGYFFYALGMVISQSFNGAGDTLTPTLINIFGFWVVQLPLAYVLARHTALGASGVFVAVAVSESMMALAGISVFRLGRWKTRKV